MNAADVEDNLVWNLAKNGVAVDCELQDNGGFWILADTTNNENVADVRAESTVGDIIKSLSFYWLDDANGYTLNGVTM